MPEGEIARLHNYIENVAVCSLEYLKVNSVRSKIVYGYWPHKNDGKKQMALKCTEISFFHVLLSR